MKKIRVIGDFRPYLIALEFAILGEGTAIATASFAFLGRFDFVSFVAFLGLGIIAAVSSRRLGDWGGAT